MGLSSIPVKTEPKSSAHLTESRTWPPFEALRRDMDRMLEAIDGDFWRRPMRRSFFNMDPLWRRELNWSSPLADVADSGDAYEIQIELAGMNEKDIDVKLTNGDLLIKGEKREDKEEKQKDFYLRERQFGSFERRFGIPEGVDTDKVEATFSSGVLTVRLPKRAEAIKPEKKIDVKAAA